MNATRKRLTLVKLASIGERSDRDLNTAPPEPFGRSQPGVCQPEGHSGTGRTAENSLGEAAPPGDAREETLNGLTNPASNRRVAEKTGRIVVDLGNSSVVKQLAKKLKREVRSWGDTILHLDALTIVARMFGHDGYDEFHARLGLANPSEADGELGPEEASRRYQQYVAVLSENDFSRDEAEHLLRTIRHGRWWDFSGEWVPTEPHGSRIRVAKIEVEFVDLETAGSLFKVFKRSLQAQGLVVEEGVRHLFAKTFGHTTFNRLINAAGLGNPSIPDFFLAPEALDERVRGYLEVFSDAGIDENSALSVLREGFGGWFGIEENEWESLRQSRHVDQIENGRRPRWRPRRIQNPTE